MQKRLIDAVQSTLQITAYINREDINKMPNEILGRFMMSKIDEARDKHHAEILKMDLLEMGRVLIQLGNHLNAASEIQEYKFLKLDYHD